VNAWPCIAKQSRQTPLPFPHWGIKGDSRINKKIPHTPCIWKKEIKKKTVENFSELPTNRPTDQQE
jgi:hypothetical protein